MTLRRKFFHPLRPHQSLSVRFSPPGTTEYMEQVAASEELIIQHSSVLTALKLTAPDYPLLLDVQQKT
ncbi:hypothetical protein HNY73_021186 [Argiope bruennichi]|uniref:Uncharacterized protein n=1 Tax=Argiope bruennichi TaxID=94029 RepID=A0A8T0EDW9_ARGBR|nr:hypothetical protein HNY73_021186 [Argiope bruennichi]